MFSPGIRATRAPTSCSTPADAGALPVRDAEHAPADAAALAFDEPKIEALRRAGFVHEGRSASIRWDGDYVDVELFGLLEDEWRATPRRSRH